jgi:hypothetical protein
MNSRALIWQVAQVAVTPQVDTTGEFDTARRECPQAVACIHWQQGCADSAQEELLVFRLEVYTLCFLDLPSPA